MIALSTLKSALKIEGTYDDADLLRLQQAAVDFIEHYTGLTLEPVVKTQYIKYWMRSRLEFAPFVEITSVKYTDPDGNTQTMPSTDYFLMFSEYPSVFMNFWEYPSIKEGTEIAVTYKAGYSVVPENINQVIIALVGSWYNNPEASAPVVLSTVPLSAQFALENLKVKGDAS